MSRKDFIAGYMAGRKVMRKRASRMKDMNKVAFDSRLMDWFNQVRDDGLYDIRAAAKRLEDAVQKADEICEFSKRDAYDEYIAYCESVASDSLGSFERRFADDPELLQAFQNDRDEIQNELYNIYVGEADIS